MSGALDYLDFDYSEDAPGQGTFDALASVRSAQVAALKAEVVLVLGWAHANFSARCGPLEHGFAWDYALQAQQECSATDALHYDEASGQLHAQLGAPVPLRYTLSLSLGGGAEFCAAFGLRFGLDT